MREQESTKCPAYSRCLLSDLCSQGTEKIVTHIAPAPGGEARPSASLWWILEGLSGGKYPGSTPCKLAGCVANLSHPQWLSVCKGLTIAPDARPAFCPALLVGP